MWTKASTGTIQVMGTIRTQPRHLGLISLGEFTCLSPPSLSLSLSPFFSPSLHCIFLHPILYAVYNFVEWESMFMTQSLLFLQT